LNFIFGIVCLFVCVCAFSLRRESPDMILGDKTPSFLRWFCYTWAAGLSPHAMALVQKSAHYCSFIFPISEFVFLILISRNLFKFRKFVINHIKLRKIQNKFLYNPFY
jgi:hypothetical protein